MRLALDPGALAWALLPGAHATRARILQGEAFTPASGLARLRELRPRLQEETGLAPGELWDLLEGLLRNVRGVPAEEFDEYRTLAERLVPEPYVPTLALALALDVDAILAADAGFARQILVRVLPAWPPARQRTLLVEEGGGSPENQPEDGG